MPATLTKLVLRPTAGTGNQTGSVPTLFGSPPSVASALSDNSDLTGVTVGARAWLATEVARVSFPTPSIPAGAKVVKVGLRRRVQTATVVSTRPRSHHRFRCLGQPLEGIGGAVQTDVVDFLWHVFQTVYPVTATQVWEEEDLGTFERGPDRKAWDAAAGGNLTSLQYELGREDSSAVPLKVSEVYLDVYYQRQSTVTMSAPTGTVTDTPRPTGQWVTASADSAPQAAWQAVIYNSAQHAAPGFEEFVSTPVADSGRVLGEAQQWTPGVDLTNDTYHMYVRTWAAFEGVGEFTSTVGYTTWDQDIVGAPDATLTQPVYDPETDRVPLTFAPSSSSPVTHAFAVQRSDDLGNTWGPVRGGKLVLATGTTPITIFDEEHEFENPSKYRVLAYGKVGDALLPAADFSPVRTVTPVNENWILLDPLDPTSKVRLPVRKKGHKVTRKRVSAVYHPVGGHGDVDPIVRRGPRYTESGELPLLVEDDALWEAIERLDGAARTLLLKKPYGVNVYCHIGVGPDQGDPMHEPGAVPGHPRRVQYRDYKMLYTGTAKPPITY